MVSKNNEKWKKALCFQNYPDAEAGPVQKTISLNLD